MSKHIFSKQELDAMDKNARIALLSRHWLAQSGGIFENGNPSKLALFALGENPLATVERAVSNGGLPDYYGSLDAAWSLVPDDSDDFNWVNIRRDGRNRFICDAEYAVGEPKDTLAEAIVDMMENYWQNEYRDYVGTFSSETATLDYAVPDFETWMQTREDSE